MDHLEEYGELLSEAELRAAWWPEVDLWGPDRPCFKTSGGFDLDNSRVESRPFLLATYIKATFEASHGRQRWAESCVRALKSELCLWTEIRSISSLSGLFFSR